MVMEKLTAKEVQQMAMEYANKNNLNLSVKIEEIEQFGTPKQALDAAIRDAVQAYEAAVGGIVETLRYDIDRQSMNGNRIMVESV